MAFGDPPRADAAESMAAMKRDGVEVKIITGDNDLVAQDLRARWTPGGNYCFGRRPGQMTDAALGHMAEDHGICACFAHAEIPHHHGAEASQACCRLHG